MRGFSNKILNRGMLRVSVPDFDMLIDIYNANYKNLVKYKNIFIMGGQNYNLNFLKSANNKNYLISLLYKNCFENCVPPTRGGRSSICHCFDPSSFEKIV